MITTKNQSFDTDEADIIKKVLSGDINLYEILMRRYNQRLYRIGRSFFKDDDEVEDVMQFTYIRAYEKLLSFENRSAFSTWLTRIFINEALARKKYREKFMHDDSEDEANELFKENDEMNTPDRYAVNNELKGLIEKAIDSLPEKYRAVFVMHEIENVSVRETSELLTLTESNVKVRLNRARKMLQSYLKNYYNPEEIYSFNLKRCDFIVQNVLTYIKNNSVLIRES